MTKKTVALLMSLLLIMISFTALTVVASDEITIKDEALERFIRREIEKPEGPIMPEDVENLRTIDTTT